MEYCYNLGQCEEDYCDCDNMLKIESEEERQANIKKGIVFALLLIGLFFVIIW